jgi:hypothetical protein
MEEQVIWFEIDSALDYCVQIIRLRIGRFQNVSGAFVDTRDGLDLQSRYSVQLVERELKMGNAVSKVRTERYICSDSIHKKEGGPCGAALEDKVRTGEFRLCHARRNSTDSI